MAGINADFYNMSNGAPSGALVMEGVKYHGAGNANFFAVLKDGTPIIGSSAEWNAHKGEIQEAVGGSIWLVRDGKVVVNATDTYYKDRASRSCVGITYDGQVVLMALDGRQEPFSAGGSAIEIAHIMQDAGCVAAINLDGGGSTRVRSPSPLSTGPRMAMNARSARRFLSCRPQNRRMCLTMRSFLRIMTI